MNNVAPIGHNKPPSDLEILQNKLSEKYANARKLAHDLAAAANASPAMIENEEQAAAITDIIREITKHDKTLEGSRISEKETYLAAGRAVDAFFKKGQDLIGTAKKNISATLTAWQNKKASEERARREAEAAAARQAAADAAALALAQEQASKPTEAAIALNQAVIAEQEAKKATVVASIKPLTHTYGNSGAMASLRTVWIGEIEDRATLDLEQLRAHISQDALDKAVSAFVRAGGRELKGAKIYEKNESVVR